MHRSSESIGTIAAALAQAQLELTNPEKSLTGKIPGMTPVGDRVFRYAPLASGLDLVRKSLGRHEIATVQTTAIDAEAGLVRLTTVLAHSSGEWVSSEWPVCPVSETASPQRMGAALTYARRYALFTLVGIAGEDDLDAPQPEGKAARAPAEASLDQVNGMAGSHAPDQASARRPAVRPIRPAGTRAQLEGELSQLLTHDEALAWAQRILPIKNTLSVEDARALEQAFEVKMVTLEPATGLEPAMEDEAAARLQAETSKRSATIATRLPSVSVPPAKTRRRRDKRHLEYVASQPCLVCGRSPSDPHHLRLAEPRALGRKVSDEFTVPLCRVHHRELHDRGDERGWWADKGLEPDAVARQLWTETRLE